MHVGDCNLNENRIGPLYVPPESSALDLRVTNCSAYNDQTTPIASTPPASGVAFNGKSYNYFGPMVFYVSGTGISNISIYNTPTGLTSGSFTLAPHPLIAGLADASITYGLLPVKFLMIGL